MTKIWKKLGQIYFLIFRNKFRTRINKFSSILKIVLQKHKISKKLMQLSCTYNEISSQDHSFVITSKFFRMRHQRRVVRIRIVMRKKIVSQFSLLLLLSLLPTFKFIQNIAILEKNITFSAASRHFFRKLKIFLQVNHEKNFKTRI